MTGRKPAQSLWAALKHAFAIPDDPDLTDQQRQWLSRIARKVAERGLSCPAVLLLESVQPLSYIGSQVFVFFKPAISTLFPPDRCDEVAALLQRRGTLKFLRRRIEHYEKARRTEAAGDQP